MFADAHAALTSGALTSRVPRLAEVGVSRLDPRAEVPRYFAVLRSALAEEMLPFCTDLYAEAYRTALANKAWTAHSLIASAQREGQDARRLWSLAAQAGDPAERQLLERHAVDQSNHTHTFLSLLDLIFPGVVDADFRTQLESLSPGYVLEQARAVPGDADERAPTLDDFIQINLGQLRNAGLQIVLRRGVEEYCPPDNVPRLTEIMDSMLRDELAHVADTARVIEHRSSGEPLHTFGEYFRQRLRDFVDATSEEPIDRGYHLRFGNYP